MKNQTELTARQIQLLSIISDSKGASTADLLNVLNNSAPKKISQITVTRELKPVINSYLKVY